MEIIDSDRIDEEMKNLKIVMRVGKELKKEIEERVEG